MGTVVETMPPVTAPALEIRLLGPVDVRRHGMQVPFARSRKLRALLAILVTETRPVSRRRLCDLLWDRPNDPRAELRWHLSKLRQVVDDPARLRITSGEDEIGIDLDGCVVDVLQVLAAERDPRPSVERLTALLDLFRGHFLGEIDLPDANAGMWLAAQRRKFSACRIDILKRLVTALPPEAGQGERYLEQWLELAPCDLDAHCALLGRLLRHGRVADAETHVAGAERLFADEALPTAELQRVWKLVRSQRHPVSTASAEAATPVVSIQEPAPGTAGTASDGPRRLALAVMPFTTGRAQPEEAGIAEGLTQDVITRLAKLRSMSIIARGSVCTLAHLGVTGAEAGRRLGVEYAASGTLRLEPGRLRVEIELVETASSRIVWAEVCETQSADLLTAVDELGNRIAAALMGEIEQTERNRAVLRAPASLDAWGAHHRGLWHMYRFTKADNTQAQHFFARAVALDPTFSRAHAGLSFTHWQNAFQSWADPVSERERAFAAASQSLLADERDPAAHWAMGRALWLRRQHDWAVAALRNSVELSPNFALGHYSLAFVESQTGDPTEAIKSSDMSRTLSPFDPLMFGMLGSRAMAHLRLGQFAEAADWATRAASRPNAHVNILGLAALCLALADRTAEGQTMVAAIHATAPRYGVGDFLTAFHFSPGKAKLLRKAAAQVSLA